MNETFSYAKWGDSSSSTKKWKDLYLIKNKNIWKSVEKASKWNERYIEEI